MSTRPHGIRWIGLAVALLMSFTAVDAQHVTGSLQLSVRDSLDDPVPGANATVSGPDVQGTQGGTTDLSGRCVIQGLSPGIVSVRISHPAYISILFENVRVQLGKITDLHAVTLHQKIHDMPELVISGDRSDITANSTTYGSNIRPADFENLPLGRAYTDMITMLTMSNLSYYGDQANIAGATGFENKNYVDGIEVTDPLFQRDGTVLPYNFIQEVEVKAGRYEADTRSALGGVLNVVTHSGTDEFHGSAFGFYTAKHLGADASG